MSLLDLILLALLLVNSVSVMVFLRRSRASTDSARLDALRADNERLERTLREELRAERAAVAEALAAVAQRQADFTERTELGLGALRQGLAADARLGREELAATLTRFGGELQQRFDRLSDSTERRLAEARNSLDTRLQEIQANNAQKLEQMRATVDEKLHATLEIRLGESFRLVSERLEQVQRGLGEMQSLATGVGDLQRVLSNVKTRGIFGEVQLAAILEMLLTADQFAQNVATRPGSNERVEFAVRLPGPGDRRNESIWLPIDAKFPREDYERLLDAQQRADVQAAADAQMALERRIRAEARAVAEKYVAPPHTTDFAILFLPIEGLYAEVLRQPGLVEALQREHRVVLAGPTTLSAILSSLRMGFRTLAIEQRSSEVWQLLGAIKTEFGRFGQMLARTKKKLDEASNVIDSAGVRSRAIERKLRGVEQIDVEDARRLLGDAGLPSEADTD